MPQISIDPQKIKSARPRQWGCLKWLLIPLVLYMTCYGGMWLFARYGGEWAISDLYSLPPNSQEMVASNYEDYYYTYQKKLYFSVGTPEEIRDLFIQSGVRIPVPFTREEEIYYNYEDYYGNRLKAREWTPRFALYYISTVSTSSWYDDGSPFCPEIKVYRNKEAFLKYYPDTMLPDGMSAFEVTMCWPDIE